MIFRADKNKTTESKKNTPNRGPGRPQYTPVIPRGKFTFTDFEEANGVATTGKDKGKGDKCTTLTLRKWLKRDLARRSKSVIVHLKGVTDEPSSENGLGRKQYVYQRRSLAGNKPTVKAAPADTATAATADTAPEVTVDVSQATKDYEAQKAALGITAQAVTVTPEDIAPTAPAPVDEAPAVAPSAPESPADVVTMAEAVPA